MTELPEGWHLKIIGDLCGQVEKIDPANLDRDTFMYLDIGALEPSSSSLENVEPISTTNAPSRARQLIREGDSVFSTVRPYMKKVAYIPREFDGEIASTGFCVLRPKVEKLNPKYLFYFLLSDQLLDQVLPLQRGVSYPAIRDNDLKSALLPLPSLLEQQKIVEILEDHLSRLDAALADVKQAKLKAAQFRRSLLHAAFTGNLTSDGTHLIIDVPNGWDKKKMDEIGQYLNGKAFKSQDWRTSGRPIIRIQNLTGSGEEYNYFQGEIEERYVVKPGDLLFSWSATLGTYIWQGPEAVLNQHIFKVESLIDKRFHRYLLDFKIQEMLSKTHGSGMVHITKKSFDAIEVSIPPLTEQQKIVAILEDHLSRLDASVAIADAMEKQSASLRRSLLQAAFTGQLTKEVASV